MRKINYIVILLFCAYQTMSFAQDSIYFYKSGKIKYAISLSGVDSLSMKAPDHYSDVRSGMVMDYLKANASFSIFAKMIQIAQLTDSLDNTTIWVPDNQSLTGLNMNDSLMIKRIVKNHITRSIIRDNKADSTKPVTMLNGKHVVFAPINNVLYFDKAIVTSVNNYVARSLIHFITGYAPYRYNIWEYITQSSANTLLKQYLLSHNSTTTPVSNDLLNMLPMLNNEDSISSAILPSDVAFNTGFTALYPYCKTSTNGNQNELTKFAIIHRNFFRGKLSPSQNSTMTNYNYFTFKVTDEFLRNSHELNLSNGSVFVDSTAAFYSAEALNQEYRIEAENVNFEKSYSYYTPKIQNSSYSTGVSENKYLYITDQATNSLTVLQASFSIPNIYSRKYNIYVVTVPGKDIDSTDLRPYKLKFSLTYPTTSGSTTTGYVNASNSLVSSVASQATFISDGKTVQKILILNNFEFPCADISMNNNKTAKVKLTIRNATARVATDMAAYNRNIGIDCIIFEPVP